jgi:hypothetical protein
MSPMLGRRYSNSVAEEGGRNTGRTWTQDGQRRQAGHAWVCRGSPPALQAEALWFPIPGTPVCPAQRTELGWLRVGESA